MAKDIYIGEILSNKEIQKEFFLMKVKLDSAFDDPLPGQFVMIRIAGLNDPFLSRPISIYSFSRGKNFCTIELLYRVVGKGTQILAGLIKTSQVEINGPLGVSFEIPPDKKKIIFVAGGIGIAPLSLLAEHLYRNGCSSKQAMSFYLGAQTAVAIVGLDKLQKLCYNIQICTDDGSMGRKCFVTDAFQKDMKKYSSADTMIYTCGPKAMVRALSKILHGSKFHCQASLEERMACGTGACMGCAVAIRDNQGNLAYKRVCADGPVFDIGHIIWD
jgi:dihydroorotate dehydrogenase electron transfer subunit